MALSWLVRALRSVAAALFVVVTFAGATVLGVVLHLNTTTARRIVVVRVNALLASSFRGHVTIENIGRLGVLGFDDVRARVDDPTGHVALVVDGARARIATLAATWSAAAGRGEIAVSAREVSARRVELELANGETGELEIQRAFEPREPAASPSTGRGLRLAIERIDIEHAVVHARLEGAPPVDIDLDAVQAGVLVAPTAFTIDVLGFTMATRGVPQNGDVRGHGDAHFAMPSATGQPRGGSMSFRGEVAEIPASVRASLDGERVDVVLDAPGIAPQDLKALWPASPLTRASSLHAEALGSLPRVDLIAHATLGDASLDLHGPLIVVGAQRADLHLVAKSVDIQALSAGAPPSSIDASGDLTLVLGDPFVANTSVNLESGTLADHKLPPTTLSATLTVGATVLGEASLIVQEPGAPASLSLHLDESDAGRLLTFEGEVRLPRLEAVPRLGPRTQGGGHLEASGSVNLDRGDVRGRIVGQLDGFSRDFFRAEHGSLTASIQGRLPDPAVDAKVLVTGVEAGPVHIARGQLHLEGTADRVHVLAHVSEPSSREVHAEAYASMVHPREVHDVQIAVSKGDERAHVAAQLLRVTGGKVVIEGGVVTGLGPPARVDVQMSPHTVHLVAEAEDIDLARLGRLLELEDQIHGGHLALDADLSVGRDIAEGHVSVGLTRGSLRCARDVTVQLDADILDRTVTGQAHADAGDLGHVDLATTSLTIGTGAESILQSLEQASGDVTVESELDLRKLAMLLPAGMNPFEGIGGILMAHAHVRRAPGKRGPPGLSVSVSTRGLVFAAARRVQGVDAQVEARIDDSTGFTELAATMNDAHGALVALDAKASEVPYAKILSSLPNALELLRSVPFDVEITVPHRDVQSLPSFLAIGGGHDQIEATLGIEGTLAAPSLLLEAHLKGKRIGPSDVAPPLDVDLSAHYDGTHATAELEGHARGEHALHAELDLNGRLLDWLEAPRSEKATWTASLRAHLHDFPLESIRRMDRRIGGLISGDLSIDGLHEDARADLTFDARGLRVGDVDYRSGHVHAKFDGHSLEASARVDQEDGFAEVHGSSGLAWGAALVPTMDPGEQLDATASAKNFDLALLTPLVEATFPDIGGRLDADAHVTLDPRTRQGHVQGTASIEKGRLTVAALDTELHDIKGTIEIGPDGALRVHDVDASGVSGRLHAAATGRLQGLRLESAEGHVEMPNSDPLRVTVQGSQLGAIYGHLDITSKTSADSLETEVRINVPKLSVDLPLVSARDVQALGPMEGVRIGSHDANGFAPVRLSSHEAMPKEQRPTDARRLHVAVHLGKDVEVKRGSDLNVTLDGEPSITITDQMQAAGQVRLRAGSVEVQGKRFEIEKGIITFVGDPSNPQVILTAVWLAPDGTHVYADFVGPLKTGKVTLRSDPALPRNEILALLVFGAPTGFQSPTTTGSSTPLTIGGIAGGAAAQPINRAFQSVGLGAITTKVDTTSSTPTPEVELQIARSLSLRIAWVLGTPTPGTNPDTTLFTLNWRVLHAWSLAATIGDAGTSIFDCIWNYRY